MRVRTLQSLRTPRGEISAGRVINIPDHLAERLKGKVEPVADTLPFRGEAEIVTPEARQESLQQGMMAIWEPSFDRIKAIWPQGFVSTPEIRAAEVEIERVQALILSGKVKIADFRQAVEAWERIVTQEVNADERH
jgi:hypothetical protein